MLLESESDLIIVLGIAAALLLGLAIVAGIIAVLKTFQIRQFQDLLFKAERKIDHLERRMFNVLNAVPVALVETDSTGKFTFANKAAHQLLGRKDSELIGLRFHSATWGITYPDGRMIAPDLLPIARTLRGQTVKGFQHLISNHGSQTRILVSVTSMPIMNTVGEVIGSTTALVELETQTGEGIGDISGVWRGQWFAAAPVPFWGLDQNGTVLDLNDNAVNLFDRDREQAIGQNWVKTFVADADFQKVIDYLSDLPSGGQLISNLGVNGAPSINVRLKGADDVLHSAILTAWNVRTQDGAAEGLTLMAVPTEVTLSAPAPLAISHATIVAPVGLNDDDAQALSDLKKAEVARAALGVGVWQYDPESDSIVEDEGMRRLIGREFEGGPTLISEADQARADEAFGKLMSGDSDVLEMEFCITQKDGSERWVALKGQGKGQNGQRELFGIALDVTAAKTVIERTVEVHVETPAPVDTTAELALTARLSTLEADLTAAQAEIDALKAVETQYKSELDALKAAPPVVVTPEPVIVTQTPSLADTLEDVVGLTRVWDRSATLTRLSRDWHSLTGCGAHEFTGEGWLDTVHDDDQARIAATVKSLIEAQTGGSISYRLKTAEGRFAPVLEHLTPLKDTDGIFDGLIGMAFDLSAHLPTPEAAPESASDTYGDKLEYLSMRARLGSMELEIANLQQGRAELQAQAQRLDAALAIAQRFETVGRLTGDVANDFAQMLGVMNSALDLIGKQSENPDLKRLSDAALAAGKRGERLTRQLQAFTQQAKENS